MGRGPQSQLGVEQNGQALRCVALRCVVAFQMLLWWQFTRQPRPPSQSALPRHPQQVVYWGRTQVPLLVMQAACAFRTPGLRHRGPSFRAKT